MRDIKFRAWDKKQKKFCDYIAIDKDGYIYGWNSFVSAYDKASESEASNFNLMQYTGLTDKAGVDIYEGDIVSVWHYNSHMNELEAPEICDVQYTEKAAFLLHGTLWQWSGFDETKASQYEVIGDIYENPELLKES